MPCVLVVAVVKVVVDCRLLIVDRWLLDVGGAVGDWLVVVVLSVLDVNASVLVNVWYEGPDASGAFQAASGRQAQPGLVMRPRKMRLALAFCVPSKLHENPSGSVMPQSFNTGSRTPLTSSWYLLLDSCMRACRPIVKL